MVCAALGVLGLLALLLALHGGLIQVGPPSRPPLPVSVPGGAAAGPPTVAPAVAVGAARYEVTGDGPATRINYMIVGAESDSVNATLPWMKSTGAPWMSVTTWRGPGPGSITCRITGGGRILAEHTAAGPYAQCTASEIQE